MDLWQLLLWGLVIVAGLAAPYGFFRLCSWLAARDWLYYKHSETGSSPASCFVALQKVIEPPAKHVLEVKEQRRTHAQEDAPGQDDRPPDESSFPKGTLDQEIAKEKDGG